MGCGTSKRKAKIFEEKASFKYIVHPHQNYSKSVSPPKTFSIIALANKTKPKETKAVSVIILKSPHENPLYIARKAARVNSTESSNSEDVNSCIDRPDQISNI
jgi:hypothetical protein